MCIRSDSSSDRKRPDRIGRRKHRFPSSAPNVSAIGVHWLNPVFQVWRKDRSPARIQWYLCVLRPFLWQIWHTDSIFPTLYYRVAEQRRCDILAISPRTPNRRSVTAPHPLFSSTLGSLRSAVSLLPIRAAARGDAFERAANDSRSRIRRSSRFPLCKLVRSPNARRDAEHWWPNESQSGNRLRMDSGISSRCNCSSLSTSEAFRPIGWRVICTISCTPWTICHHDPLHWSSL